MSENTKIAWTDSTFNPWLGCTRVSEGCRNCYAETLVQGRMGLQRWGSAARVRTKGPWREVRKWNREASQAGVRRRVFCASLCDVFEDAPGLDATRADLWPLIDECTSLDWQLLTKRPENITRMVPASWLSSPRTHVWLGTSVENQEVADVRIPRLLAVPAAVRFLSCEPLLGPIDLKGANGALCNADEFWVALERATMDGFVTPVEALAAHRRMQADRGGRPCIDWVIVGGESGSKHRPMDLAWARSLRDQCRVAGVAFFFKQLGGTRPGTGADALGEIVQEFPNA